MRSGNGSGSPLPIGYPGDTSSAVPNPGRRLDSHRIRERLRKATVFGDPRSEHKKQTGEIKLGDHQFFEQRCKLSPWLSTGIKRKTPRATSSYEGEEHHQFRDNCDGLASRYEGCQERGIPYVRRHPSVGFRRCSKQREGDKEATCVNVDVVARSNATSLSTFSFPSARRRVWDLALTSPFGICHPARSLGRLITGGGITVFREIMIECAIV